MNSKPVTPVVHGIIDYVFSAILLVAPSGISIDAKTAKTYGALGAGFLIMNSLTDTPVGIKRTLSFKDHQKADAIFLTTLSLLTFSNFIRKDKQALRFHIGFLTTAIAHYILTDYKAGSQY